MRSLLLPQKCLLCYRSCLNHYDLCEECEQELPWLPEQFYPPLLLFNKSVALFHYDFPVNYMIAQLKFQHQLIYASLLGKLLSQKIATAYRNESLPELIIPVPLHINRLRERGFNQALEIAKPISNHLQIPINFQDCLRSVNTLPQSSLTAAARKQNIKKAFIIVKEIPATHIVLIDDVITTGQTITELGHTFKNAGTQKIDIWCCARTVPGKIY
jgi:ComF family protein